MQRNTAITEENGGATSRRSQGRGTWVAGLCEALEGVATSNWNMMRRPTGRTSEKSQVSCSVTRGSSVFVYRKCERGSRPGTDGVRTKQLYKNVASIAESPTRYRCYQD